MSVSALLEELERAPHFARNVTAWRRQEPQAARLAPLPADCHPDLASALEAKGIRSLYAHQALAWQAARQGRHLAVVTPTASGKTLCYNLPVLDALLRDARARALYLFPTKALSQDQLAELEDLASRMSASRIAPAVYDGDTPTGARAAIRRTARIVITNPDMLHRGILPHHTNWMGFFQNLRFVVLDEVHTYRGVFGSHVANVLRRLKRVCAFYGASPQFICSSATIGNPLELSRRLVEEDIVLIDEDGSPKGEKHLVFYNPPLLDAETGLRRAALLEAVALAARAVEMDVQTIVFARSRQSAEVLLTYLRDAVRKRKRNPDAVHGYRGGYLPRERREIEKALREGAARAVVSTNALELGIDIGHLEACVMAGYPGTIASTWQQAGRAGRRKGASVAVLVASADPLDQYIVRHPDYFFGRSPEHALIHPDNARILESHVRCAAFELPFRDGETLGAAEATPDILARLEQEGVLRHAAGTWYWMSEAYPADALSLRVADADAFTVESVDEEGKPYAIGVVDRASAPRFLYPGAVYMHEGRQYLVESVQWEEGRARVRPEPVDYYTDAMGTSDVSVLRVAQDDPVAGRGFGDVRVVRRVTGYRKVKMYTHETLGWGEVNLPEQSMDTTAYWLTVPDAVLDNLRAAGAWDVEPITDYGPNWDAQRELARQRDGYRCRVCGAPERPGRRHDVHHLIPFREFGYVPGENDRYRQANDLGNLITVCHICHTRIETSKAAEGGLHGLAHVLVHLAPLFLMAAPQDLGVSASVQAPDTRRPTIYLYDDVPGGVGFAERLYELHRDLLRAAEELVAACPCSDGCPSCVGPVDDPDAQTKAHTLLLVREMLRLGSHVNSG